MRRLVVVLLLIPAVTAQINEPQEFSADYGFSNLAQAEVLTVLSGALSADVQSKSAASVFFDAYGMRVDGLGQVCWPEGQAFDCASGDLALVVSDGGNVAIGLDGNATVGYEAPHALAVFLNASAQEVNGLSLNENLMAPAVDGVVTFDAIEPIPEFTLGSDLSQLNNVLTGLDATTTVALYNAGSLEREFVGTEKQLVFTGQPEIPTFKSDLVVLPFGESSEAHFTTASADAAAQGLSLQRIQDSYARLNAASRGGQSNSGDVASSGVDEALAEILDSALVRVPINGDASELAIVLFEEMNIVNRQGLAWTGLAAFQYTDGDVAGKQELVGVSVFQLPIWGWAIWVVALGVFVARLALSPDKTSERWDRYKYVGWIATVAAAAVVFYLWDIEMRAIWGTSVLTTSTEGTPFWITFAIQLGTLSIVMGALGWPLSILFKNGLLLAKQGTFMGLAKPISMIVAYGLGATLFLSYMDIILDMVVARLG